MFLRHKLCHKDASRLEGGGLRHLLWATTSCPDISTLAFRSNSNSHSNCDSQHKAGDSLSDLNAHWSSNLGALRYVKVKSQGYSLCNTTNEAIFKHLQTMRIKSCYIEWAHSVKNEDSPAASWKTVEKAKFLNTFTPQMPSHLSLPNHMWMQNFQGAFLS